MLILGLLGMYFDAAVVFVTSQTLFLRLALAILCNLSEDQPNLSFPLKCYRVLCVSSREWGQ